MFKFVLIILAITAYSLNTEVNPLHFLKAQKDLLDGIKRNLNFLDANQKTINAKCLFGLAIAKEVFKLSLNIGTEVLQFDTKTFNETAAKLYQNSLYHIASSSELEAEDKLRIRIIELMEKNQFWVHKPVFASGQLNHSKLSNPTTDIFVIRHSALDFTDHSICLKNFLEIDPKNNCKDDVYPACRKKYLYGSTRSSSSNIYKLLIKQAAFQKKCIEEKRYKAIAVSICSNLYQEIISYGVINRLNKKIIFFLQAGVLCGYEGFSDFFKLSWLEKLLRIQDPYGCFPATTDFDTINSISKRSSVVEEDGCNMEATGFGLANLALYYNYVLQKGQYSP